MSEKSGGRKSVYDEIIQPNLEKICEWAKAGLTDDDIMKNLGVGKTAYYKYKSNKEEFANILKSAKAAADEIVENALYKRAIGGTIEETVDELDEDGNVLRRRVVKKQIPGDTTAQIFWLKNRKSDVWRDKHEFDASVLGGIEIILNVKKPDGHHGTESLADESES
jgi:transcriptional regulator with XRE-family HTH domain